MFLVLRGTCSRCRGMKFWEKEQLLIKARKTQVLELCNPQVLFSAESASLAKHLESWSSLEQSLWTLLYRTEYHVWERSEKSLFSAY